MGFVDVHCLAPEALVAVVSNRDSYGHPPRNVQIHYFYSVSLIGGLGRFHPSTLIFLLGPETSGVDRFVPATPDVDASSTTGGGTILGTEKMALNVRLASTMSIIVGLKPPRTRAARKNLRALSKTLFGFKVKASLAKFAGIPNIVPKLTTSSGPLTPISECAEPEEKMIPFPPVIRMISRAFERKF